jgi:hypothetical protein
MRWPKRTEAERFWAHVDKRGPDECWPWLASCRGRGYGAFRAANGRMVDAHRMAYILTNGPPVSGVVRHRCDNPPCCNPRCLLDGSQADNLHDMVERGRQATGARCNHPPQDGERNHGAKLSADIVAEIRRLYAAGTPQFRIAQQLGVSKANVWVIVHRKSWTG